MKIFSRMLGLWRGALLAALAIACYTLLGGAGASVVRAAIMGDFSVFALGGNTIMELQATLHFYPYYPTGVCCIWKAYGAALNKCRPAEFRLYETIVAGESVYVLSSA